VVCGSGACEEADIFRRMGEPPWWFLCSKGVLFLFLEANYKQCESEKTLELLFLSIQTQLHVRASSLLYVI
jgi:hypothetical protein